jgi:hypothetical protein
VATLLAPPRPAEPARSLSHPVYRRGRPRVRPWPFDASIDGVGVMLGGRKKGGGPTLTARKPEDQGNVSPSDFGENAQNPVFGRSQTWRTFHLGMGLSVEDEDPTRAEGRYRWAINADCSVASRLAMKGPRITSLSPNVATRDSQVGVTKFFDLANKLYFLNGRYLQRVDDDGSVTTVGDFGVNAWAIDVAVFASNFFPETTPVYAYIACLDKSVLLTPVPHAQGLSASDPEEPGVNPLAAPPPDQAGEYADMRMWRFDGTTLAQHSNPAMTARALCVIGRDLYRANGINQVSTVDVDSDPWVYTNWRADNQYLLGDKSSAIVSLVANAVGALVVLKTDGVYSVDQAGEQIRYYPFMRFGQNAGSGFNWGVYMNDLYVRYAESLYRIDADFRIEEVGPNRMGTVDGPVKGRTTAFAGHGNFHAYTGMWDADTDTAFLMKYGAHQPNEKGEPERVEAWHGSLCYPMATNRITTLYATSFRAAPGHTRMYVGYRDGTIGFFALPCVPDPAACDQYRYSVEPSWVVLPNWHGGFPSNQKPLRYVAVSGDNLDGDNYATVSFRLDPVAADASLLMPWIALSGHFDTLPSERIEFPERTQCATGALRLELSNIASEKSPLISSMSLRWRLSTDLQQVYDMYILAEDGLVTRDGTPLRRGAKGIRDHVRALADSGQVFEVVLADEDIKLVSIYDYGEAISWWERGRRWVSALQVGIAEDATGNVYGTYGRLRAMRYGDLRGMKYGDLRRI